MSLVPVTSVLFEVSEIPFGKLNLEESYGDNSCRVSTSVDDATTETGAVVLFMLLP